MSRQPARALALYLWAAGATLAATSGVLLFLNRSHYDAAALTSEGVRLGLGLAYVSIGALVVTRRPDNRLCWLLLAIGGIMVTSNLASNWGIFTVLTAPNSLPAGLPAMWIGYWLLTLALPGGWALLLLLFPNGRLPSSRWRPIAWLIGIGSLLLVAAAATTPEFEPFGSLSTVRVANPVGVPAAAHAIAWIDHAGFVLGMVAVLAASAAAILRLRRARGDERQQLKWAAYFAGLDFTMVAISLAGAAVLGPVARPANELTNVTLIVVASGFPVATAIAVFRYRLYDIDVIISRTLLYGGLAAFITGLYVIIVVGLGTLIGTGGKPNLGLSIVATAAVAVAFQPAREALQGLANRLIFGRRATPYEVIAGFAHRMATTLSADDVLPRMAEAAALGVGARAAEVSLFLPAGGVRSSTWPGENQVVAPDRTLDIVHRGERIGQIAVAQPPDEPLTPVDGKLLADLAVQAELVLHNARLNLELQSRVAEISAQADDIRASRQRLVTARDSERRRLEQTLQDGVRRDLAGIAAGLRSVEDRIADDPAAAAAMFTQLTARTTRALDELRDVARGIFPPLLVDRGLVAALEAHLRRRELDAAVLADDAAAARFEPRVEATVYFCCVEALRGASAGPRRRSTTVRLGVADGALQFSVSPMLGESGVQAMRDRVEALGGSLVVEGDGCGGRALACLIPNLPGAAGPMAATG